MITVETLARLTNMTTTELTQAFEQAGYKDESFLTARFVGITNAWQFCYSVQYEDEDEGLIANKVFVTYNPAHNTITAEY